MNVLGFITATIVGTSSCWGQLDADLVLARAIVDKRSSSTEFEAVVAVARGRIPLLLRWADTPPLSVPRGELYAGMATIFGRVRETSAIPFLIKNIAVRGEVWMKAPDSAMHYLPAARALVEIGPPAVSHLLKALEGR
jgi:hypothetical protein